MSWLSSVGAGAGSGGTLGGPVGALIGAGVGALGQWSANSANRDIAHETNQANMAIARAQMQFQERMSSTAHQREVSDLVAAGLNPILSAGGSGSSSPVGASIAAQTGAPMQNTLSGAAAAIASAREAKMFAAQLEQVKWQTRKTISDTDLNNILKVSALADANLKDSNAKVANINANNLKLAQSGLKVESDIDKSKFGQVVRYLGRLNPLSQSALSVSKVIK